MISRRNWLQALGLSLSVSADAGKMFAMATPGQENAQPDASGQRLALVDFEPKSMLQLPETRIERARFPAVDIHTHISTTKLAVLGPGTPACLRRRPKSTRS